MTNGNEPAYPCHSDHHTKPNVGLSKRELVAAMAMQGTLSNPEAMAYLTEHHGDNLDTAFERLAEKSVRLSDALLTELNKTT